MEFSKFLGSGYFNVDNSNKKFFGNLYFNKDDRVPFLEIEIKSENTILSYKELESKVKYISGELSNGFKLTLLNCNRIGISDDIINRITKVKYIAEFMFEGLKISNESEDLFKSVDFVLPDIMLWGNKSCYEVGEDINSIRVKEDNNSILIIETNDYVFKYDIRFTMPFLNNIFLEQEIKLIQEPIIIIESKEPKNFDFFVEKYNIIKRFIEIGVRREVNLSEIISYPFNKFTVEEESDFYSPVRVKSYLDAEKNTKTNYSELIKYLYNLDDVKNYCDSKVYVKNLKKLEPIIDLYLSIIYSKNITVIGAFLNVVQALEAFHSRFICNGDINEFKNRINIILKDRLSTKDKDRKFLLANSKKFITLGSRIADLLLAEFNILFYTGDIDCKNFPKIVVNTRNYYTHYDEKLIDKIIKYEDLAIYVDILLKILEYYLLKEIGFSEVDYRIKQYHKSIKDTKTYFDYKKLSKN